MLLKQRRITLMVLGLLTSDDNLGKQVDFGPEHAFDMVIVAISMCRALSRGGGRRIFTRQVSGSGLTGDLGIPSPCRG